MEINIQVQEAFNMNKLGLIILLLIGACSKNIQIGNREFYLSEINQQYDFGIEGFRVDILMGTIDDKGLNLKGIIYDTGDCPINELPIKIKDKGKIKQLCLTNSNGEFLITIEDISGEGDLIFGGNEIYVKREFSLQKILASN
jgi:hypothetical protein